MDSQELEERKRFYKMLLGSLSPDMRLDEIFHLAERDLQVLMKQFEEYEDYELCQVFKIALDQKR